MTNQEPVSGNDSVYKEQNLKSTEDLLAIWQANDRAEWSEAAFAAIRRILLERLGSLPPQKEAAAADGDRYYDIDKVTSLSGMTSTAAWIVLGGFVITGFANFLSGLSGSPLNAALVLSMLVFILQGIFFFVVLRVLAEGLYLLLEIAENSR